MRKLALLLLGALVLASCQESLEDAAARKAKEDTRRSCPVQQDQFTRMDSITFDKETHTLNYFYTLSGPLDNDTLYEQKRGELHAQMSEAMRKTTDVKMYKDAGYNFAYIYFSETERGKVLYVDTLKKGDY